MSAATQRRIRFTDRAYLRSHGKGPRGRGTWAFRASRTEEAYDADLYGEIVMVTGTAQEARREAKRQIDADLIAVLP